MGNECHESFSFVFLHFQCFSTCLAYTSNKLYKLKLVVGSTMKVQECFHQISWWRLNKSHCLT